MFMARITGSIVSSQKVESMVGQKLLIVEPCGSTTRHGRKSIPQADLHRRRTVGAGEGEVVLCVPGSSARFTEQTEKLPIDAAIVGIVDQVHVGNHTVPIPN
ncbi:MAG: ethanolamine utilization protein EutN [Planctomycetaceae bacterium]|nr:MAG: ethanolamine utilization protein EutN [Planctomycetaceae bacterium]